MRRSADLDFCFDSPAPESTFELAALLGRAIGSRGLVLGLIGPLGAGKTCFVKGLAEGLGLDHRIVSSPTFAIAQQYPLPEGPELLHHLDLYRLESESELESLGLSDWLGPGQVVAVEWLDRFPEALGPERLEVLFEASSPFTSAPEEVGRRALCEVDTRVRRLKLSAFGPEATRVLRDLVRRCERLAADGPAATSDSGGRSLRRTREEIGTLALLLAAGWIGVDALRAEGSGSDRSTHPDRLACASLAVATPGTVDSADARDALGPLAVGCADPIGARTAATPGTPALDGIAQLLDGGALDPNTATAALLAQLPGLGAARAAAIVETRARSPFTSLDDLERVPGIGPKTRAGLEPFLAVDSKRRPG